MKLAVLFGFLIAFVAVTFVQADALQDEIDSALKKFCGGNVSMLLSHIIFFKRASL